MSARHWGCPSAFRASREPIRHFTNARTPPFWQRPWSGWRPIRNAPTRFSTSPTAISSGGRICGPNSPISSGWSWLRHDTSTLRDRWRIRGRSGKTSSKSTDCRDSASKRLRRGAIRTAYSLPITISSPTPARPAASDSTIWWTPRRCFFGCSRIFGVNGSFRDLPAAVTTRKMIMATLTGKTALVTGASRGIGRASALALAKAGAQVLVHYGRGRKEAEAVVAEIRNGGGRADAIEADLAAPDGPHKLAKLTRNIVGDRLDILVANAGVSKTATIEATTIER